MIHEQIQEAIRDACRKAVKSLYNNSIAPETIGLEWTRREIDGDVTVVVFPLTRISRKSPEMTATEIGHFLLEEVHLIKRFHVIKGFLNLTMIPSFWTDFIADTYDNPGFGIRQVNGDTPVIVEYSSPNTNKPLHLGHIRNNLLGSALAEILEANGTPVKRVNLINDRGIHICKSLLAYMKWGKGETPSSSGIKGDHLVGKYYVLFEKQYKEEIAGMMATGMTEEDAARSANLILEAQDILRQWESHDQDILRLWKTMNGWTYEGFDQTYARMGISFDRLYYESETYLLGKQLIEEGLDRGVFYRKKDGSVWVDLTADGLDEKLLLRSDGTSVYITQDLGTALLRYREFKPSRMIYVVGNEQLYHFEVLKLILKRLDPQVGETIYHFSYGMVELPDGKMKSREGKVVDADDLMEEMAQTAEGITRELGKVEGLSDSEAATLFETIGMGALKYFILKVDPKKNMLFNPAESIDFNGNTGPFIQYTYARIQSLIRRTVSAGNDEATENALPDTRTGAIDSPGQLSPVEINLSKLLYRFPEVITQAGTDLSPAILANYVFDLAREYNQFYQEIPVLREDDPGLRLFRIRLSRLTGEVIKTSMSLLGINVPARM